MHRGVIFVRPIIWVAVLEAMCAVLSATSWDIMPVSVLRGCLENPQCKGRVLLDREGLVDLRLLLELLGQEVKSVGLHKLQRDLRDRLVQLGMCNRPECMQ